MSSCTNPGPDGSAFCGYNHSVDTGRWVLAPYQYEDTHCLGEVGLMCASNNVRPGLVGTDTTLRGNNQTISMCNPYQGAWSNENNPDNWEVMAAYDRNTYTPPSSDYYLQEHIGQVKRRVKNEKKNQSNLVSAYTREKRSADNLDAIDFNRWQPLYQNHQRPDNTIEDMWVQRGGLHSRSYAKDVTYSSDGKRYNEFVPGAAILNATVSKLQNIPYSS